MRTFSQADWQAALKAWSDGDFSPEWKPYRHQAAMRGMIYPPEGSKWDSWDDDQPSQRALLIRTIRETPSLMAQAIERSHSWHDVVAYIIKRRDDIRAELDARERLVDIDKPTHRQAMQSIAAILQRINDAR